VLRKREDEERGDIMGDVEEKGIDFADLAAQFGEFENQWIAIDANAEKIVANGATLLEVDREAERQGYENVFLFKVPRSDQGFAPHSQDEI
jgi:hypothetical protein